MKKNIAIVVLIIFCGLFLLYGFQQKSEADVSRELSIALQIELAQCKEEAEQQKQIAEKAMNEAMKQAAIAKRQAELALEATNASK
jgi:hypothetical protein